MELAEFIRERTRLKKMRVMAESLLDDHPPGESRRVIEQTLLKIEVELLFLKLRLNSEY